MSIFDNLVTAVFKPARQLGPYSVTPAGVAPLLPFSAQVTVKELHTDELVITEHPVEQGASVTDHAFKKPSELMLILAWSNSGIQSALQAVQGLAGLITGDQSGDFNYMQTVYNKLLVLQESRIPINVTTGKRKYSNMLIRSMTVPTEDVTEHSLFVTMILREIIIVTTQAVLSTSPDVMANPQSNAPIANVGNRAPKLTTLNLDSATGLLSSAIVGAAQ